MTSATEPAPPRASATVLLLRDGARGPEVFMLRRHGMVDFAAGALVFPGGKVDRGDRDPALAGLADGLAGLDAEEAAHRAAAVREAFEEAGILLARDAAGTFPDAARLAALAPWRGRLDRGEAALTGFLAAEGLRLAADRVVPLARWITPAANPRRFDTRFYLAPAPDGQAGLHDGRETVESGWHRPADLLAAAEAGTWSLVPATRAHLMLVAGCADVAAALSMAAAHPKAPVTPVLERRPDGMLVRIPAEAGYGRTEFPLERMP